MKARNKSGAPFRDEMEIAGVPFLITSQHAAILNGPNPAYDSFTDEKNSKPGADHIKVTLELDHLPDTNTLTRIFETGESWSMFRKGKEYYLSLHPPSYKGKAFWTARFDLSFREVIVYCSEKMIVRQNGHMKVRNPVHYPLDQLLLMYYLAKKKGLLLHAAGMDIQGRGLVFPGQSGAGKSTLARTFAGREKMVLLSDDRMIVRKMDGGFKTFGTPWPGDAGVALNRSVPLSSILFLYHDAGNKIEKIGPRQALKNLFQVTSIPWYDREVMTEILAFCEELVLNVPAFELHFMPGEAAAGLLEEFALS